MLKEILLGAYINLSSFFASYLLITALVSLRRSQVEKIIFTYLLHLNNIILILFFLNCFPSGITPRNVFIISQLYLIFSLALCLLQKRFPLFSRHLSIKIPRRKTLFILSILLLINVLINLYAIYLSPPVEPDTLAYHLQAPPNWYQNQNLNFFFSNEHRTMLISDNLNFFSLWLFLSFQNDAFIEIAPYSMFLFGSLVIFYLLQNLEKNPSRNFILSLLFFYGGSYLSYFSTSFTNDVGLAALTFASLALLYSYLRRKENLYLLFFSLSNGLLLGTKTIAPLSIFLIYLLALSGEVLLRRRGNWEKIFISYFFSIVVCLVVGGFFYFRNFYYFHNPLYGKEINFLNLLRLPGTNLRAYQPFGLNFNKGLGFSLGLLKKLFSGALGFQVTLFYLPAITTLFLFFRKKINKIILLFILYPLLCGFLSLSLFGDNPLRYFFSLSLTGILSLATLLRLIKNRGVVKLGYWLTTVFLLFISCQRIFLSPMTKSWLNRNLPLKPTAMPYYDGDYYFFFHNIPQGTTLVYLLPENTFLYPLYGSRYENRLIYANSSQEEEIIQLLKDSGAEYFLGKKPEGDLCNSFLRTDLEQNTIKVIPEEEVYTTINELVEKGILIPLGSGTRIDFYKINETVNHEI